MKAAWSIGLVTLAMAGAARADGQDVGRVGWHFYQDPIEAAPQPAKPAVASVRPPELVEFTRMQKTLEELRNVAIVTPSESNVRRYLEFERMIVAKASLFADVARRVSWKVPGLDGTTEGRPVSALGLQVYDKQRAEARAARLAGLARDHALLFFFKSDCPYCHAYAPILSRFAARYGITVEPVSLDGQGLPEFPVPRRDNGMATRLGIKQVPALFLAQPFKGDIITVGYGLMSADALEERVAEVADPASDPGIKATELTK